MSAVQSTSGKQTQAIPQDREPRTRFGNLDDGAKPFGDLLEDSAQKVRRLPGREPRHFSPREGQCFSVGIYAPRLQPLPEESHSPCQGVGVVRGLLTLRRKFTIGA